MRSSLLTSTAFCISLIFGGAAYSQNFQSTRAGYDNIDASQARAILDSGSDVLFLDVRETYEFDGGHIPGATNMPWNSGVLRDHHSELPNKPIIVYCRSGGRSAQASQFLVDQGRSNITNMLGGYMAYAALPTRTQTVTPTASFASSPTPTATLETTSTPTETLTRTATPSPTPTFTTDFDPTGDDRVDSEDLLVFVAGIRSGSWEGGILFDFARIWKADLGQQSR